MIYLIHGENLVESRRFLIRLKSSYQEVYAFPGEKLDRLRFKKFLSELTSSLFGGKAAVIVENFSGDWDLLPANLPLDLDIIFWSSRKVEAKSGVKTFLFEKKKAVSTFKLADAILLRNRKLAYIYLDELLKRKEVPEKILGALLRSLVLLYSLKDNSLTEKDIAGFIYRKIEDQAKLWKKRDLKKAFLDLIIADLALKEGKKPQVILTALVSRLTGV